MTGHTGFKGSWLCHWLEALGATVAGYSLPPETNPNHFDLLATGGWGSAVGDVSEAERLANTVAETRPEIVFHLAAQPLVRRSYLKPVETFAANVMGTLNLMEACRDQSSVCAIVVVTSDKVYENRESPIGYEETSPLGGADPYSCSKACAELVTACCRQAFFSKEKTLVASARAGNVIGGGDWSEDRLIPDAVRAASTDETLIIRNPRSVRPWQHVLEPLAGYLLLGQRLLAGDAACARAWNFGPDEASHVPVGQVVADFKREWPELSHHSPEGSFGPHETKLLKLDSLLARSELRWKPVWGWQETIRRTARWYREYYTKGAVCTAEDLSAYMIDATAAGCGWALS